MNADVDLDERERRLAFVVGLLGNLALAVLKISFALSGLVAYSALVLMDGFFSLINGVAFLLPWQVEATKRMVSRREIAYGAGKALFLSMFVIGLSYLVLGVHMAFYGLTKGQWLAGQGARTGAALVTAISVAANEVLYRYLVQAVKGRPGALVASCALHNRIGVWLSSAVLFSLMLSGLAAAYFLKVTALLISAPVFVVGIRMLSTGLSGIMDRAPGQQVLAQLRSYARSVEKVKDVVDIKSRYVGTTLDVDVWIAVDDGVDMKAADGIARNVEKQLIEKIPLPGEVNVIVA